MNTDAFLAGYLDGHDGKHPYVPAAVAENEELESTKPNVHDPDWAWRLIGWAVGQAVAQNELAR